MRRLSERQAKFIANIFGEAKKKAGLTNQAIADKSGYNERVVRDVLHARCRTFQTATDICAAVEINLNEALTRAGLQEDEGTESNAFGGYTKGSYGNLIGSYTTIRPGYSDPGNLIKCYQTAIQWDAGHMALCFSERKRDEQYHQEGHIHIPPASAFMYLLTTKNGWVRTILISQPVNNAPVMRGLILSQFNSSGPHYAPVCSPIVFIKEAAEDVEVGYGDVYDSDHRYGQYRALLDETISRGFVKIAVPQLATPEQKGDD